jgi:hypothetical protein
MGKSFGCNIITRSARPTQTTIQPLNWLDYSLSIPWPNVPEISLDEPGLERWPCLESAMPLAS